MAYLKAHEVRAKLQSKMDPDAVDALCKIVESQQEHRQTFYMIADIVDNLTKQFSTVIAAATKMTPENIRATLMGSVGGQTTKEAVQSLQESDDSTRSTG